MKTTLPRLVPSSRARGSFYIAYRLGGHLLDRDGAVAQPGQSRPVAGGHRLGLLDGGTSFLQLLFDLVKVNESSAHLVGEGCVPLKIIRPLHAHTLEHRTQHFEVA